jgi:hypothetical protein
MALEDIAPGVFGQFPDMSGSLSPEQIQSLQNNAAKQAILASAVTMLGMSGNQRVPVSTGQALGAALGAGSGAYQGSFDNTLKQMITGQQMQDYRTKADARKRYQQAIAGATTRQPIAIPMAQGQGSQLEFLSRPEFGGDMAATETGAALRANLPIRDVVDQNVAAQAALDYVRQEYPDKYLEFTAKTAKTDKVPDKIQQYQFAITPEGGGFKGSYTDFIRSGTPSTNVSVSMDKGIAAQIGPMLKDERIQAQGAANQIDASDRIIQAVNTNKIITVKKQKKNT